MHLDLCAATKPEHTSTSHIWRKFDATVQTIDYENTATALLPAVAASYVLHATGRRLWAMYKEFLRLRDEGNFSTLPELHALSSGLKAVCTDIASDSIEVCRRTCGGHGYSQLSGLPTLYASYVQNVTWEGDNQARRLELLHALALCMGCKCVALQCIDGG